MQNDTRPTSSTVFTSKQPPSSLINRLEVSLPDNRVFSFPVLPELTGSDLISQIELYGIVDYVICRKPADASTKFWDILYLSKYHEVIDKCIKLSQPFGSLKISEFFVMTSYIKTQNQIMPLYVFKISDVVNEIKIMYLSVGHSNVMECIKPTPKIKIRVKLPTGLIYSIKMLPSDKIKDISINIHKKMKEIYGGESIRPSKKYLFGTINHYFPEDISICFSDDKILSEALRNQKIRPKEVYFIYHQKHSKSKYHKITQGYVRDLELSQYPDNDEINSLNTSLSLMRTEIESNRIAKLTENPLLARMRISTTEPPIPESCKTKIINIKTELRNSGINEKTTGVSFKISADSNANEAIKRVFGRMIWVLSEYGHKRQDSESNTSELRKSKMMKNRNSDIFASSVLDCFVDCSIQRNTTLASSANPPSLLTKEDDSPSNSGTTSSNDIKIFNSKEARENRFSVPHFDGDIPLYSENLIDGKFFFKDRSWDPNDYVLKIQGLDEVISGDIPLYHFQHIRHFLLSNRISILNTLLVTKQSVIESVQGRELNPNTDVPEPKKSNLTKFIQCNNIVKTNFFHMPAFPHTLTKEFLTIDIQYCHNLPFKKTNEYCVKVCLINGVRALSDQVSTRIAFGESTALFNDMITIPIPLHMIPRTARLSFTVYCTNICKDPKLRVTEPIATYNFAVFAFNGWLNSGKFTKKMWINHDMDYLMTTCESNEETFVVFHFSLPEYHFPLSFVDKPKITKLDDRRTIRLSDKEKKRLDELSNIDPLVVLDESDKNLLKKSRFSLPGFTQLQLLFLASINYMDEDEVTEIPLLLEMWDKPSPVKAMSLLDAKYPDRIVREYAVNCLSDFTDEEIMLYLLQLIQALKYELYDDSALARFLLRRGLSEPKFLGHQIFWQITSEAHISHIRQRFSAYLVNFLYGIGIYREEFLKGYKFTKDLVNLNNIIRHKEKKKTLDGPEILKYFRKKLEDIQIPEEFHLPMDPRLIVDKFIVDKCRIMDSKKRPFMLVFHNATPFSLEPIVVIFKCGDDLRQDQLTLQIMKVMEHLWREEGLDLQMRCYAVLPTGKDQGFVEVVQNSETEAKIQKEKGTISGVISKNIFLDYLKNFNTKDNYLKAIENFRLSSAGYAVATCVLGVADRHPDNVMIQQDGHFFHIDFGHFLGNFKKKYGYQRENAPFHFSDACEACIGQPNSPEYMMFEQDCTRAFNILRRNANLLITLLILMLGTGIPELKKPDDLLYIKNKLVLDMTEEQAAAEFIKLIKESKESTKTTINNFFHNVNR